MAKAKEPEVEVEEILEEETIDVKLTTNVKYEGALYAVGDTVTIPVAHADHFKKVAIVLE